jgi:hypothetical protein
MARRESDREDLMRKAVVLVRRCECETADENDSVISGFRKCGSLSLYFGTDPVYHFDSSARLRRAFGGGCLFRTQGTTLARLERVRTDSVTELRRHDLTDGELRAFLVTMRTRLQNFSAALEAGNYRLLKQVPSAEPIVPELVGALKRILLTTELLAPPISGKG